MPDPADSQILKTEKIKKKISKLVFKFQVISNYFKFYLQNYKKKIFFARPSLKTKKKFIKKNFFFCLIQPILNTKD